MLINEIFFLIIFLPFIIGSHRYYAFIETLFVIDTQFFPPLSSISDSEYIRTIVDTANIIFQSQNDLDVKIEVVISDIRRLNIMEQESREPYAYEKTLRQYVSDYDRYDSIVLLSYQPWEGPHGAQGYAMIKGICSSANKIMYLLPYQNAAFYLAHEIGHQLGLVHQVNTTCYTTNHMSVMTLAHTASYEQARWTKCENNWINNNICEFKCLFNKPNDYQPIKNKYSKLPGSRMDNNQQAKIINPKANLMGEASSYSYMPSDTASRCLYFQYYTGGLNNEFIRGFTPMLPGSECGINAICYLDKCISKDNIDPSLLTIENDTDMLDLATHCKSGNDPNQLSASNHDPRSNIGCIDWENDLLCEQSQSCPDDDDSSTYALYVKHICCKKCSPNTHVFDAMFSRARLNKNNSISILIIFIYFIFQY